MSNKIILSMVLAFQVLTYTSQSYGNINYKLLDEEAKVYQRSITSGDRVDREEVEGSLIFVDEGCVFDPKYLDKSSFSSYQRRVLESIAGHEAFLRFVDICGEIFQENKATLKGPAVYMLLESVALKYLSFVETKRKKAALREKRRLQKLQQKIDELTVTKKRGLSITHRDPTLTLVK